MLRGFAGGTIFGERTGDGTPKVLALHGWARSHRDFAAVLGPGAGAPGAGPLDAIAVDLAGFGVAPAPPEPWGSDEYARWLEPILAEMAPSVVVLGHSFGGRVALKLAVAHPGRVRALVLSGTPLGPRPGRRARPPTGYRVVRVLRRAGLVGEGAMEGARQRHGSADYRAAQGVMRQVLVRAIQEEKEDYARALGALKCPVRLVWGEGDTEAPLEVARGVADRMERVTLEVCAGGGHLTPLSVPGALRRAVEEALSGTGAPGGAAEDSRR